MIDVNAALARYQEQLDSKLPPRERAMAYCCCPEDGSELRAGQLMHDRARDRDSNKRDSETQIVCCPRCRFWMRLFEREKHRPWMGRAWDIFHARLVAQHANRS